MASSKRERELARMRAERQAARRAAAEAARRRRRQTVLASIAGLAVVAVAVGVAWAAGDDDAKDTLRTAASNTPTASANPASGTCSYNSSGTSSKKIKGTPPTTGVSKAAAIPVALNTNRGEIELSLTAAKAPCTVNSFTFLAKQKYFEGTSCHRLTTSGLFVLQCGDPSGTGGGGPGYQFADENLKGAVYPKGTVAMANAGAGTNGSQFFLVYKDTQLPPQYTPFGTITKGLDVLDTVAKAGSDPAGDGKPKLAVTLKTVTIKA